MIFVAGNIVLGFPFLYFMVMGLFSGMSLMGEVDRAEHLIGMLGFLFYSSIVVLFNGFMIRKFLEKKVVYIFVAVSLLILSSLVGKQFLL
jgi:hypothetical protein